MTRSLQFLSLFLFLFTLSHLGAQSDSEQLQKLVASDRGDGDRFGRSVAISGDYAIVGAPSEDEDADGMNTAAGAGSAYLFERNAAGDWIEQQKLVASDRALSDVFGWSVAISGDYAIVGALGEDEDADGMNTANSAGSAYLFERNGAGDWIEQQKLVASDRAAGDGFGRSVAISGDYAIVGAVNEDEDADGMNTADLAGSAYLFERNAAGDWIEQQKLVASDRGDGDRFSWSVAISGDYAIVGAVDEDEDADGMNTADFAGSAYLFERNGAGDWIEQQKLVASDRGDGDRFGRSVAISGDYAIVGALDEDEDADGMNTADLAGSAYLFERNGAGDWIEQQKLVASDRGDGDRFSWSVAISGDYAIVGAASEDEDADGMNTADLAGSAYLFERNGAGDWIEQQKLVASDRGDGDRFGFSVAISGDYAIVGAVNEDEDADGGNTSSGAGSAYVFGPACELVCEETVTVNLGEDGTALMANDLALISFTGGCTDRVNGPFTVGGQNARMFDCDDIGETIERRMVYNAQDGSGEVIGCDYTVIVEDNEDPVITCQDVTVFLDENGNSELSEQDILDATVTGADDNCGGLVVISNALLTPTCDNVGENPENVQVQDASGNPSNDCMFNIIVRDTISPVIMVTPQTVTLSDNSGTATLTVDQLASATDNCDIESLTASQLLFTCEDIGEVAVTITATDVNDNVSTATVLVTVLFNQPNLACIGEINVTLDDECGATLTPQMLLTGNVACLDVFDFEIVVQDDVTANGPVIDGCGTFNYMIRSVGTGLFELDFETCWGVVNAEDKTPPQEIGEEEDVELLCVDLDGNNVSTLPASVSKCYRVDGQTGMTIFNADGTSTMAPALRARLLAGGSADDEDARPKVPTFRDGCADELIVCVSDAVQFGMDPDCDDVVITRTFVATEDGTCVSAAGEENDPATASYVLTFTRPSLEDLRDDNIEPVVYIESCGADPSVRPAPRTGLGTKDSPNDFPFLEVGGSDRDDYESSDYYGEEARIFYLSTGTDVCNIGVTFQDGPSIVTCPNTYKFVRTYTVIDWCNPSEVETFTQVVKVGDTTAPTFVGPNVEMDDDSTLVYGTNAGNSCAAFIRLDDVSVMDNCPGAVSIIAEIFPNGNLTGAPIGAFTVVPGGAPELTPAIPAGTHILRYTYSDVCGNTGVTDYDFRVEDQTPPVAICEDGLNVSVAGGANNGFAVLTPANIDNGSYDDCSGVTLEIARVNASNVAIGSYGTQITLTCADVETGIVRVGLKVTDALDNMNFCWLDVLVEDKIAPTCVAPANTTITCVEYNASLPNDITDASFAQLDALFGQAAGVDNCGTTITQTVSGTINSCGVGRITREFTSTDDVGFTNTNICRQVIDVIGVHDYRITFPTDEEGDCMEIPAFDAVVAEELACDLITTTVDVDTLRTQLAGDECFKLRVTYDVVNWCEYNSLGEPYLVRRDAPGARDASRSPRNIDEDLLYVNVITGATTAIITDDIAFYTLIGTDRVLNNADNGPAAAAVQQDQEYVGYADVANRDRRGFFRYVQFIKIYDEVAPEVTFTEPAECFAGSGEGCRTTVTLEFTATDECSDATVSVMLDANFTGVFAADNAAALGINVDVVNDGEGNFTLTATEVPVGDHAIRVRANDGCGNSDVQIIEFCVTADRTPTPICIQTLTVTLMNDGNGGGIAAIWASDFIASPIVDCFGNVVDKYSLYRSSETGEVGFVPVVGQVGIDDIDCDDLGDLSVRVYAFDNNGSTPDYCEVIVEVQDNMGHCDGSTGDLSGLISTPNDEVIAGVQVSLTSSAGMDEVTMTSATGTFRFTGLALNADYTVQPVFAAAFNAQNVRASDLVAGIGQILGTAPFTSAYQFVAADVNQDGSFDVFDVLAGQRAILGLDDGFAGGNWFMVEAGAEISMNNPYAVAFPEVYNANDLQGAVTADFVAVEKMNLTGATGRMAQTLNVDDAKLESGQFRTIILDGTHTAGFQGTIELAAGLELISADLTGQGGLNLNRAGEGLIAVLLREGGSVSLEVRATTSGLVSELISLSDAVVVREGVALNGTSNGLDLAFNADFAPATAQNVLHQNTPNPVRTETVIRFELATAAPATLTLRDVAGRLVSVQEIDAAAGLNTVELTNIKASGVLSYTLTSGNFTATKQMVVVE